MKGDVGRRSACAEASDDGFEQGEATSEQGVREHQLVREDVQAVGVKQAVHLRVLPLAERRRLLRSRQQQLWPLVRHCPIWRRRRRTQVWLLRRRRRRRRRPHARRWPWIRLRPWRSPQVLHRRHRWRWRWGRPPLARHRRWPRRRLRRRTQVWLLRRRRRRGESSKIRRQRRRRRRRWLPRARLRRAAVAGGCALHVSLLRLALARTLPAPLWRRRLATARGGGLRLRRLI